MPKYPQTFTANHLRFCFNLVAIKVKDKNRILRIIPHMAFSVSMHGGEISEWHVKDPEIYRARTSWKSESRCQSIFFAVPQPAAEEWGLALPVPMSRMRRQRETATSDQSWTHAAVRFPVHGCCSNFFSVTSTNLGQRWNSEECLHNTFCPLECLAGWWRGPTLANIVSGGNGILARMVCCISVAEICPI